MRSVEIVDEVRRQRRSSSRTRCTSPSQCAPASIDRALRTPLTFPETGPTHTRLRGVPGARFLDARGRLNMVDYQIATLHVPKARAGARRVHISFLSQSASAGISTPFSTGRATMETASTHGDTAVIRFPSAILSRTLATLRQLDKRTRPGRTQIAELRAVAPAPRIAGRGPRITDRSHGQSACVGIRKSGLGD